jgi:signal transduction histidine kinase
MQESPRVSAEEVERRKRYLEIAPRDEERIRKAHSIIQKHAERIIERFYDYLFSHPHTGAVLSAPGVLERLKSLQRTYFDRLTSGPYDQAYFEDRVRIGMAHDRIGLSPEWYLGAYHKYLEIVSDVLSREMGRDYQGFFDTLVSLTKIIYLDMGLAMDAYINAGKLRLEERNRRLEELDSQKQLLSETIVHDLRNPVAGIQGFLWSLKKGAPLSDSQKEALLEAERACDMLNTMVDNVLSISRMEEGKLELATEEFDPAELSEEIVRSMSAYARGRGKEMRSRTAGAPRSLTADRDLVKRVLLNLVMNSIRHATGGTYVEVAAAAAGDKVRLGVADDGPGIPKEVQPLLFEKFGGTRLRKTGMKLDTGLGLVFCRMAVKRLGSELKIDSDAGRGATFSFDL